MISLKKLTDFKSKRNKKGILYNLDQIDHIIYNDLPLNLDELDKDVSKADKYNKRKKPEKK